MIKILLEKGQVEIVLGERFLVKGDPIRFEAHIYLDRGKDMHGGVGETPQEALFNAVSHWRSSSEVKT